MAVKTSKYADLNLEDPVAIIGLPSVGLVSSIVANYYVGQLKMEPIAGMSSPSMPPYCLINGNRALPPLRFYGRKHTTKTGRDVIICLSEYAPKPEDCYELVHAVYNYLKYMGVKDVICLEGIAKMPENNICVTCGSGEGSRKMMRKSKFTAIDSGMIKGFNGVMLYMGPDYGMDVTALIVPANPVLPDPGASIQFIPAISKMVPGLRVSTKPLQAEADEICRHIQEGASKANDTEALYG